MVTPVTDDDLDTLDAWVVHSPYPDGTWRGIEKCASTEAGAPLLFFSEQEAVNFIEEIMEAGLMIPVRVVLTTPSARRPLASLVPAATRS